MRIAVIVAGLAVAMTSSQALADDSRPLTVQRDGTRVGIVPTTIRRDGIVVSAVLSFTPKSDAPPWASLVSIDCVHHKLFSARLPRPEEGAAAIRPAQGAYHPIQEGSVGGILAAALCPSDVPADISIGAVGGGPTTSLPVGRPR
jgi:hypothetical protein